MHIDGVQEGTCPMFALPVHECFAMLPAKCNRVATLAAYNRRYAMMVRQCRGEPADGFSTDHWHIGECHDPAVGLRRVAHAPCKYSTHAGISIGVIAKHDFASGVLQKGAARRVARFDDGHDARQCVHQGSCGRYGYGHAVG